jgi:hypothetical protein
MIEKHDTNADVIKDRVVIIADTPSIVKDKDDYYSITLNLVEVGER